MRRLYVVTETLWPRMDGRKAWWYAHALAEAGWSVRAIATRGRDDELDSDPARTRLIQVDRLKPPPQALERVLHSIGLAGLSTRLRARALAGRLRRRLREAPGVTLGLGPPWAVCGAVARAAARAGSPVAVDCRAPVPLQSPARLRFLHEVDLLGVLTTEEGAALREAGLLGRQTPLMVIPDGYAGPLPAAAPPGSQTPRIAVWAGRMQPDEQPEVAIRAWLSWCDSLPPGGPAPRLYVAGPRTRHYNRAVRPLLDEDRVHFVGDLGESAIGALRQQAALGIVTLAAHAPPAACPDHLFGCLAAARGVIAAVPEGTAARILHASAAGLVVDPGRPEALAGALEKAMQPEAVDHLGRAALRARGRLTLRESVLAASGRFKTLAERAAQDGPPAGG
jgi:glycosyltransferase involved in cell wall biosynthesis